MEGTGKFALIQTQNDDGEQEVAHPPPLKSAKFDLESLLEKSKLSQESIKAITACYSNVDQIISCNKSLEQIAMEFELDSIDKFRFIRNISKIINEKRKQQSLIKPIIVSSQEQQCIDKLYKKYESVSNIINEIQQNMTNLNESCDAETKSITDYFDNELIKKIVNKKQELLTMIDDLNKTKYEILQKQIKDTESYLKQLENAKTKCNELTSSNSMSLYLRKQEIMKYEKDLCCSNSKNHVPICLITQPMIKFDIDKYLKSMDDDLYKHLYIDDCDQPIIRSVELLNNAPHSISISWKIDDEIFNKLKLHLDKHGESKVKTKMKFNPVMDELINKVDKIKAISKVRGNNKLGIRYKDVKTAKKKCKIIFQVSWKEIKEPLSLNEDDHDDKSEEDEKEEEEGGFMVTQKKKKENSSKSVKKKKKKLLNEVIDDEKSDDSLWIFSDEIYDSFSFIARYLNCGCKYIFRVRSKYRKSKDWGVWSSNFMFSTESINLRWSKQKCNNNPEPKFDAKHPNKIKLKQGSISKVGVEYVINGKKYDLFTVRYRIDKFSKSGKKGAVYLGFMTSNIDTYKLNANMYNNIYNLQNEIRQNSKSYARKLHKRNIYYKVVLGNTQGFEPVSKDPFGYCIEIKEDKKYIKMYTPSKQGKEIELPSKISTDDIWDFEFRMKKKYCFVYRNGELIMNKKYFYDIPNAVCPIISNSRHNNACTVLVFAGRCNRIKS